MDCRVLSQRRYARTIASAHLIYGCAIYVDGLYVCVQYTWVNAPCCGVARTAVAVEGREETGRTCWQEPARCADGEGDELQTRYRRANILEH
jgi:hypothetical protein